jgi:uncharacterized protein (TIGR00369 family)
MDKERREMDIIELKTFEVGYLSSVASPVITPVTKWLNPRLIFVDETSLECEYVVRPEMADPPGWLHGGIRAAMLCDMLGVYANFLGDRKPAITTSMNVDFIGKAFVGEKVRLIAEVINKGSSLIYMSGKILNEQNQIVARGSTSLFVLDLEKIKASRTPFDVDLT